MRDVIAVLAALAAALIAAGSVWIVRDKRRAYQGRRRKAAAS